MRAAHENGTKLQRTFYDLSEKEIAALDTASILAREHWAGTAAWDDLLKSPRILIVSEAGSGKTYECQTRRDLLWHAGEPAFFLDLATLAAAPLGDMLSADQEARFDAWRTSQSDVATFFLDSLDELKLSLKSLELALNKLGKAIAGHLGRARIVITTRPIPVDQKLIRQHLPVQEKIEAQATADSFADVAMQRSQKNEQKSDQPKQWRHVALMPLSNEQIKQMAAIEGVTDPDELLADIRRRDAEDFARRPQDLIEICANWRDHHRIGKHAEQVASNVTIKLKARTDREERCQLADNKALEGASRVALAVALTRKLTIRHNAESDTVETNEAALEPANILPDWTAEERGTLLERALFGFATYGRVRFHHRSVVEYLAAKRLNTLLDQGRPISAIKRLLFSETVVGEHVVRPSMRAVAAWLALSRDELFEEVLRREPAVLLDYGDPQSLRPAQRIQALDSYVRRYGLGGWRGMNVPQIQVHRFAGPELGPLIQQHWNTGIENEEVRELLLELIAAGRIHSCADIAFNILSDASRPHREFIVALDTLISLDDTRLDNVAKLIEEGSVAWPDSLIRAFALRLFPKRLRVAGLCRILASVSESRSSIGDLSWQLPRIITDAELSARELEELRGFLDELILTSAVWRSNKWPPIVTQRPHLLGALAAVCLRQISNGVVTPDLLRSTAIALRLKQRDHDSDHDGPKKELRGKLAHLSPEARETTFWEEDDFLQSMHESKDLWRRAFDVARHGAIDLNVQKDRAWIRRILIDPAQASVRRTIMLFVEIHCLPISGPDWQEHVKSLKPLVADSAELLALIDQRLRPPKEDPELLAMEAEMKARQEKHDREETEAHESWAKFWHEIAENPEAVFSPDRAENTAWNLWHAMARSGEESRASGWNRRFIRRQFGDETADRLRLALMPLWRKDLPTLRSERAANQQDTYLTRWQLGLAAIAAEAEDPQWAEKLSRDEAALAARYAPIELNGFPSWLESLVRAHPQAVDATLGQELTANLNEPLSANPHSIFLQNISHASPSVIELFSPRIRAWLKSANLGVPSEEDRGAAERRLNSALDILTTNDPDEGTGFIRDTARAQLANGFEGRLAGIWLSVLIRLDPEAGVGTLESGLKDQPIGPDGPGVGWIADLFGDRHSGLLIDLQQPAFTPVLLLRLVRLAYRHVRPGDDAVHEGSYTPNRRDYAERGRSAILGAVLALKGIEGWNTKLEMANDPMFAHFKDRAIMLARERAAEEADGIVLSEAQVAEIDARGEAAPTSRDAMFALTRDRLLDLDDVLLQDTSPREAWAKIEDERVMRRVIAHELRHLANRAYTVDQEAVTADEKETDIRLRSTLSDQQATIELKIGEKDRSAAELRHALKEQLVTKYMAAENSRSGCLLITIASNRTWRHPDTQEALDLASLIEMLNEEAQKLSLELSGEIRLMAKGLDLRPRLTTEKVRKKS
jgi:hypothetical protein